MSAATGVSGYLRRCGAPGRQDPRRSRDSTGPGSSCPAGASPSPHRAAPSPHSSPGACPPTAPPPAPSGSGCGGAPPAGIRRTRPRPFPASIPLRTNPPARPGAAAGFETGSGSICPPQCVSCWSLLSSGTATIRLFSQYVAPSSRSTTAAAASAGEISSVLSYWR